MFPTVSHVLIPSSYALEAAFLCYGGNLQYHPARRNSPLPPLWSRRFFRTGRASPATDASYPLYHRYFPHHTDYFGVFLPSPLDNPFGNTHGIIYTPASFDDVALELNAGRHHLLSKQGQGEEVRIQGSLRHFSFCAHSAFCRGGTQKRQSDFSKDIQVFRGMVHTNR